MLAQRVKVEEEQIEALKIWPELKSMRDIQVLLDFANFYRRFIPSFSKIAGPFSLMLRTNSATKSSKNLPLSIDVAKIDKVGVDGGCNCKDKTVTRSLSKNLNKATDYLSLNTKRAFTQWRKAFTIAPIL